MEETGIFSGNLYRTRGEHTKSTQKAPEPTQESNPKNAEMLNDKNTHTQKLHTKRYKSTVITRMFIHVFNFDTT